MPHDTYLSDVLILLLAAVLVVSLFRFFKASPILGYLFAGLTIGPHALGFISSVEGTKVLGEFGVVFLLFTIGLKMPLKRFQALGRYVFGLGALQVAVTGVLFTGILYLLDLSLKTAFIVGMGLALSSTAVVMQYLTEKGELSTKFGRAAFAVLLFQDLAVVILLVLSTTLGNRDASLVEALRLAAINAVVVLTCIILVGRLLLRPLYRVIASLKNQELFVAISLLIVLITSLATDAVGLSKELGAFLAGLLLSETEYRHQVEADIQPFYGLLLGLFFMTVGMGINVYLLVEYFATIMAIIAALVLLKSVLLYWLCRVYKITAISSLRIALLLAAGGEFVFVLFIPGVENGLITPHQGQLLFLSVAVSMGLTPFLGMIGKYVETKWMEKHGKSAMQSASDDIDDLKDHFIIAGYGRVGKIITCMLKEQEIPFIVLDNNMSRVTEGRTRGIPIFFGDVRRHSVMRALGVEKAKGVVISINDAKAAVAATMILRRHHPHVEVSIRLTDDKYDAKLTQAGAIVVKPENMEPSLQLASSVLRAAGTPSNEINDTLNILRASYITRTRI